VRKSVMPRDKELILPIVLIAILPKMNELHNIQGSFGCKGAVNVLIYNAIRIFSTVFHVRKKRGLGVFLLTVYFTIR